MGVRCGWGLVAASPLWVSVILISLPMNCQSGSWVHGAKKIRGSLCPKLCRKLCRRGAVPQGTYPHPGQSYEAESLLRVFGVFRGLPSCHRRAGLLPRQCGGRFLASRRVVGKTLAGGGSDCPRRRPLVQPFPGIAPQPVSYTHLTLPTSDLV